MKLIILTVLLLYSLKFCGPALFWGLREVGTEVVVAQSWWFDTTFLCMRIWYSQSSRPGTLLFLVFSVFFTSTFNLAPVISDFAYLNCVFYLYVWLLKCSALSNSQHNSVLSIQGPKFLFLAPFFKRHNETFLYSVHFWCFDEQKL